MASRTNTQGIRNVTGASRTLYITITKDNVVVLWVIFVQFESVFVKVEQIKLNVRF